MELAISIALGIILGGLGFIGLCYGVVKLLAWFLMWKINKEWSGNSFFQNWK